MNTYLLWAAIILSVINFFALIIIVAIKNRTNSGSFEIEQELERIIGEAGYAFDRKQNIFYSRPDAWQRKHGYCQLYDEAAAPSGIIFDCEPIRFEYDNKNWLIEFWKGQYGITTGCEVGVYLTEGPTLNLPEVFDYTLYNCAGDKDLLPISCSLKKGGKVLFSRSGVHWWLTGFILGEYSEPSELEMDVAITLRDSAMCKAFLDKLVELGYSENELKIYKNTVSFTFSKPYSPQPFTRTRFISMFSQRKNKFFCSLYKDITKGAANIYEAVRAVKRESPELYDLIVNMGKPLKLFKDIKLPNWLTAGRGEAE